MKKKQKGVNIAFVWLGDVIQPPAR